MSSATQEEDQRANIPLRGAPSLHVLPAEVIERVLTLSDPRDVSRYAQTCRYAHKIVYEAEDQYLWRELFLARPFDDLRRAIATPKGRINAPTPSETVPHPNAAPGIWWRPELQRRVEAELIASSGTRDAQVLQVAYEAILSAIDTAIPVDVDGADSDGHSEANASAGKEARTTSPECAPALRCSENIRWADRVLRQTRLLDTIPAYIGVTTDFPSPQPENARADPDDELPEVSLPPVWLVHTQQMRARLRACVALAHENNYEAASKARMATLRKTSRAFVYDMRKYQPSTLWGPYRTGEDGRTVLVNWEHIEHILNVVGLKLREIPVASLAFYKKPLFQMDALLTGTWRRFVCFMDYRDLYMFNYSHLEPGPHHPDFFNDPFDEALRPVELTLTLIPRDVYFAEPHRIPFDPSTSASRSSSRGGPIGDCDDDPRFPTLYFKGFSRGAQHSNDATIRGKVSTLSDGAVRWQFVTSYDGRMQWSAEGVQVGHVCSAAGVAGIWTGAHHDRDDPAGPFWMVKVSDELPVGVLNILH